MAKTQDILARCTDAAATALPNEGGAFPANDAAIYLAHTEHRESLRALASATGASPSTMMQTVRRVETRRDDPFVDATLTEIGALVRKDAPPANSNFAPDPSMSRIELEREASRFLRRLSEPGSFLLVAPETPMGGIFCRANEFRKPIAMMTATIAAAFVREGWIRLFGRGSGSLRYRITEDGRSFLKRLLAEDTLKRRPAAGFCEVATPFLMQHQIEGERTFMNPETGAEETRRVNLGEDPLGWLARRRGPDGEPFLAPAEVEAGERLRMDFETAQLGPSVAQDWRKFLTPGDRLAGSPVGRGPAAGPMAARDRVSSALSALGPGLSDVALRVCCFLEGLEACERRMGWSARSGKVVLKIALQRLAGHYGLALA